MMITPRELIEQKLKEGEWNPYRDALTRTRSWSEDRAAQRAFYNTIIELIDVASLARKGASKEVSRGLSAIIKNLKVVLPKLDRIRDQCDAEMDEKGLIPHSSPGYRG